jgi:photosystem II stability/assembly factor-like uncharacterized protein
VLVLLTSCAAPGPIGTPSGSASPIVAPSPTPTPAATSSPTVIATAAPAGPQPSAVRFADAVHGWLGVEDGILGTSDGGTTWQRQLNAGRITRIWSFDATHASAVAADSSLFRTADGSHWVGVLGLAAAFTEVRFVTASAGWATTVILSTSPPLTGVGSVHATTDGGATWRPVNTRSIWSICFFDETDGIGAAGKQIFATTDAGRTWSPLATLEINDDGPWFPSLFCADRSAMRVQVTEPKVGLGHAAYVVLRSVDGGKTWKQEYREGYTLGIGEPTVPGLGSYPAIIGTLPAARTWIVTCTPAMDTQEFLVLDAAGRVMKNEKAPFVSCARDATFVDEEHGWAIATDYTAVNAGGTSRNVLLRTTDARTWSRVYP